MQTPFDPDPAQRCNSPEEGEAYRAVCVEAIAVFRAAVANWEQTYMLTNDGIPFPPSIPLQGDTFIRWRRAYVGTRAAAAKLLERDIQTLARWENDKCAIPLSVWLQIRATDPKLARKADLPAMYNTKAAEYREPKEEWEVPKPRKLYTHRSRRI